MFNLKEKKAYIVKADQKLVDWLLSLNTNNRNIRKKHIEWLENAINNDEFVLTGQAVSISKEGALIDGQHRLLAIKKSGYKPVDLMIATGLSKESQMYVDQHAKRSMSDMLKLSLDREISKSMAAIVSFLLTMKETPEGFTRRDMRPSIRDTYNMMEEIKDDLSTILQACGKGIRVGALAAIYHYSLKVGMAKAEEFALEVRDGENITKKDASYRLREYLRTHRGGGGTQAMTTYRMTVTACIAHSQERSLENMRPSDSWESLGRARNKIKGKK